ncbi:hypothetical protein [uncultured Aquimarina sp.]|uniref:hypothetical protein n=1 Tax=uncultured Aquimarina sp. TaxID=575652 RepID=UPI0026233A22|nr:hypothetical protein [uncultured Aquimarina sp.]
MKSKIFKKITTSSVALFFIVSFLLSCEKNSQTDDLTEDPQQIEVTDEELAEDKDYIAMESLSEEIFTEYRAVLKSSGVSIDDYKKILLNKDEEAAEEIFRGKEEFFSNKISLMKMHIAVLSEKYPSLLDGVPVDETYDDYILRSEKSINGLETGFLNDADSKNLYRCPPSYFRCMAIAFGTGGICVVSTAGLVSWACILLYGFQAIDCVLSHCQRV